MIIRSDQIDSMTCSQVKSYKRRLLTFFRGTIPETTDKLTESALLDVIDEGLRKARTYGIEGDPSVKRFIGLMLLVNPRFDEDEAVQRFLRLPDLDPDSRIKVLSDLTSQKLRSGE